MPSLQFVDYLVHDHLVVEVYGKQGGRKTSRKESSSVTPAKSTAVKHSERNQSVNSAVANGGFRVSLKAVFLHIMLYIVFCSIPPYTKWRLLISINLISSAKEVNPITRKSMSKLGIQPSQSLR